jgi:hypothetical protein
MASKKKGQLTKQCRIYQWIEAQDASFAAAIRDLCLEGALSPGGRGGVTFLYPKDNAYRAEIVDKAYSDDADEAVKLIESLIIQDALVTGTDFTRRAIGSRLGIKYVVEGADATKVKLAGGIELVPAEDFRPLERRSKDIAVWVVAKGRLPLTGEAFKAAPQERKKTPGAGARGGAESGTLNDRQLMAAAVEGEFDRCMRQDHCRTHNPYLAKVVSLLNFLQHRSPETYQKVLPMLDYDPVVCFYLLLEPYKARGEFLIADSELFGDGAWNGADAYGSAVAEYEAVFKSLASVQALCALDPSSGQPVVPFTFRDRAAVAAQVDVVRQQFASLNPRQGPQLVQDVYAVLSTQNDIRGLRPIFPDSTVRALAGSKKLWQDEFRFTVHEALQTMRSMPYSTAVFASIVRDLRTAWPGDDYGGEIRLSNVKDLQLNVAPRNELLLLAKFINSTDFLYTPVAPDVVGGAWGSASNPMDWNVYNRNHAALQTLRLTKGMVRPSGISPQALAELQIYASIYGHLPPAISALGKPQ